MSQTTDQNPTTPPTTPPAEKVSVGNPKDIQGILALAIIIGYVAIAAAVIFTHLVTDPTAILTGLSTLAAAVSSFYFGVKSQQSS